MLSVSFYTILRDTPDLYNPTLKALSVGALTGGSSKLPNCRSLITALQLVICDTEPSVTNLTRQSRDTKQFIAFTALTSAPVLLHSVSELINNHSLREADNAILPRIKIA